MNVKRKTNFTAVANARALICSVTVNFQQTYTEEKVSAINLLVFIVFTDITLFSLLKARPLAYRGDGYQRRLLATSSLQPTLTEKALV